MLFALKENVANLVYNINTIDQCLNYEIQLF